MLEHAGGAAQRLFSEDEEHTHARNHEPLYRVVATAAGDVVVEVFAIRAPAAPTPANPPARSGPPAPMMLEVAMPLSSVDQSNFGPIRRNLLINCSGALALLVTVVVAGLGFRSYAHGKYPEKQLEIAGQVQSELLPRKAGHATVYPLAAVVGEAIIDYLKHGRPKTEDRHLFFRIYAPQAPISAAAVPSSVALYLHEAAIQVRRAGSHAPRCRPTSDWR